MASIDGIPAQPVIVTPVIRRSEQGWLLLCLILLAGGCDRSDGYLRLAGPTMGTQYQVTARCATRPRDLEAAVTAELRVVNGTMSTYDTESELSRFNRAGVGEWHAVSPSLFHVVQAAQRVSVETHGAFDATVGPLVNLWGFGPATDADRRVPGVPDVEAVAAARRQIGYESLRLRPDPPSLWKDKALYVDLSAIAKGYGVDRLAELLRGYGCADFLVDIGGEVRVAGVSPRGTGWRIGVEQPEADQYGGVQRILELTDVAVATSGDYRNFVDIGNRRFSHTIDPRSGTPIDHALASVTVVHPSAMWADAYATAINVLGPDAGYAFAEHQGLAAYLLVHTPDGFEARYTADLLRYFTQES